VINFPENINSIAFVIADTEFSVRQKPNFKILFIRIS